MAVQPIIMDNETNCAKQHLTLWFRNPTIWSTRPFTVTSSTDFTHTHTHTSDSLSPGHWAPALAMTPPGHLQLRLHAFHFSAGFPNPPQLSFQPQFSLPTIYLGLPFLQGPLGSTGLDFFKNTLPGNSINTIWPQPILNHEDIKSFTTQLHEFTFPTHARLRR